ncbi:unnamed protein product [Vitrella brassicaformis CCMP3155]|uniref:Uncharacterized protein n=2 Tax=Vitrella brassicaformis TaxID=1169539 RepID=A0A0G4EU69_VITBC|nr:unnamed protein product [Vitrella brassicaformis CCMP3155]|eukprot:CEM01957.1 unnamed protein product [Vitrella brassicaformis CCMP3155]
MELAVKPRHAATSPQLDREGTVPQPRRHSEEAKRAIHATAPPSVDGEAPQLSEVQRLVEGDLHALRDEWPQMGLSWEREPPTTSPTLDSQEEVTQQPDGDAHAEPGPAGDDSAVWFYAYKLTIAVAPLSLYSVSGLVPTWHREGTSLPFHLHFQIRLVFPTGYPDVPFGAVFLSPIYHPIFHEGYVFNFPYDTTIRQFARAVYAQLLRPTWVPTLSFRRHTNDPLLSLMGLSIRSPTSDMVPSSEGPQDENPIARSSLAEDVSGRASPPPPVPPPAGPLLLPPPVAASRATSMQGAGEKVPQRANAALDRYMHLAGPAEEGLTTDQEGKEQEDPYWWMSEPLMTAADARHRYATPLPPFGAPWRRAALNSLKLPLTELTGPNGVREKRSSSASSQSAVKRRSRVVQILPHDQGFSVQILHRKTDDSLDENEMDSGMTPEVDEATKRLRTLVDTLNWLDSTEPDLPPLQTLKQKRLINDIAAYAETKAKDAKRRSQSAGGSRASSKERPSAAGKETPSPMREFLMSEGLMPGIQHRRQPTARERHDPWVRRRSRWDGRGVDKEAAMLLVGEAKAKTSAK